jgi:DNA-binding MarR family transcriptional regulator
MSKGCFTMAKGLELFQSHWRFFPVQHMRFFFEVARNDLERQEWGVLEMAERLGVPQATASRHIQDLSKWNVPKGHDPIDLVTTRTAPDNYRKRIPMLTDKGLHVFRRLDAILSNRV